MKFFSMKTNTLLLLMLMYAGFPLLLSAQERDDNAGQTRFSTASLCGNYGAIAIYGANVARALGFEIMDGHGKITGAAIVNQPGPNNTRTVVNIGISGTYIINAEGMGTMTLTIALPSGGSPTVTENFVVTKSKVVDGVAVATEIQDAQEIPSAVIDDSSLVVHTYTLRGTPKPCGPAH